nr:TetR/AcrR family transcriptional regulator [Kibdelosporangium sp. MJ126-NF4]CEL21034.1 Transcriptional regulator, TetR family [Kibdelosporangium sp. MJ126-NF4]CTQ95452.1 Transcriptional regulator, TetR family [Kibdelosporangium sp. MJ126-NF4]
MSTQEIGSTRERILLTAREMFSARSYRATSMREIAERVGITKPSLYHHFRSKAEILDSLISAPIDELAAAVEAAADDGSDLGEIRTGVLRGCVDVMVTHREVMALLLRDASVYTDQTAQLVSRTLDIVQRATDLLAGPDAGWRDRLRATQAFAAATDPIAHFPDPPEAELRAELLAGASAILGLDLQQARAWNTSPRVFS